MIPLDGISECRHLINIVLFNSLVVLGLALEEKVLLLQKIQNFLVSLLCDSILDSWRLVLLEYVRELL